MRPQIPDFSHWTGEVDFKKTKAAGIQAVIVKASQQVEDDTFKTYWANAKATGLFRGAYHYLDWRKSEIDQATLFSGLLARDVGELPPILDLEMNPAIVSTSLSPNFVEEKGPRPFSLIKPFKGGPIDIPMKTSAYSTIAPVDMKNKVLNFLNIVEKATGKVPMIYSGYYYWNDFMTSEALWLKYSFWLAWYNDETVIKTPLPWSKWTLWQYTDRADGAGFGAPYATSLDMSYFNGTSDDLIKFAGGTVIVPTPVTPPHPDICPTCHQKWPQGILYRIKIGDYPNVHEIMYGPVIGVMAPGTQITVDDNTSQLYYAHFIPQLNYPKGGWVYKDYIEKV